MTSLNELLPVIKRAARNVAYQWPGVVEADDVEQSICVRLLESEGSVEKIIAMDQMAKYRAIVGMGHQIASQERTDYAHYKGAYRYSVNEVKQLLKSGALKEHDEGVNAVDYSEEKVSTGKSEPTTLIPVQVTDLRAALKLLADRNENYAVALINRYRLDEIPQTQRDKDALKNGTTALTNEMNRVRRTDHVTRDDGPGTRQPITREQARFQSKDAWDATYTPAQIRDNAIEPEVQP
ncbi:hypothetical protein SEA_TOPANGA_50 [Mycobacterium phage Topanga]|nr:hypothetical protein SEA_TOPANGA_50 [Mycobacterium phage Topanga]